MSNPSSDSYRNVLRHQGQDYSFAPRFFRPRDPLSPTHASSDIKPKENQGYYPLASFWSTSTNGNLWALASITNNLANWILLSTGTSGPMIQFTGGTGTTGFPVNPNATGQVQLSSNNQSIVITGTSSAINFDLPNGGQAIETVTVDTHTAPQTGNIVSPVSGNITVNGALVGAGTHPVRTDTTANGQYNIEVQTSQAVASSTAANCGLSHFNSAQFTVDSNGFVSISNFTPFNYLQIAHSNSPYTIDTTSSPNEYISCDSTLGTISILLPNAPTNYRQFTIKDRTGQASTNNITVTTVGGTVTIDGQTTYTIVSNYTSINLLFNGTNYEIF